MKGKLYWRIKVNSKWSYQAVTEDELIELTSIHRSSLYE